MDPGFSQRLLCLIHSWFLGILKRIPQDGTFNQTTPLPWLIGSQECFSYDLTTATDGVRFKKYAVLDDDVVIADAKVASVYKSVLQRLGVSLPKSLISNSGCIEFAKK
ncbi:Uncharacterized mitochondrial protein AtMg01410 [Striga hermonthica]|uniref:Uncharacterized mitochondrial protein AtMg01410 n=1 Tax=Striga hermonthica TaxID=68872 RepID=A0A9N7MPD9_STRHE|nr:Uncharacterized mitochondrial protein AtMg01410 [Striga hermonthica]